ncbi:MAG TPA: PEP/pyruvate-binding domain-containing protein, partial [Ignavibacteriaceae bacterium]|nr:PEP/pyruvate-binding domain-containing protein [Ignavibacteriaceae bacterium]
MSFFKKIKKPQKERSISFKEKLHHFQNLLYSNDEALKEMAQLSEVLSSGQPFSKGEIYRLYSEILSHTRDVADHLSAMCNGKYKSLINQINKIENECKTIIAPGSYCPTRWDCEKPECKDCNQQVNMLPNRAYSYRIDEITLNHTREVGGKMSRLCEIHNKLLIPIPDGFCITSRFFEDFLAQGDLYSQIDNAISSIDFNDNSQIQQVSQVIQALIIATPIPQLIEKIILNNYEFLSSKNGDVLLSVRSSAVGEDDLHHSFAGLHYTALNVSKANLIDACFEVLISKYLPQSLVYRYLTGLRDVDMPMSIGCLQMIDSEISGVLFTRDPIGKREGMIIHAVRGLGNKIVDGSVSPQEFIVESKRGKLLYFSPGNQQYKTVSRKTDGLKEEKLAESIIKTPCLTKEQLRDIVEYAKRIENYFGTPQDIEWTINSSGKILLLQSRP